MGDLLKVSDFLANEECPRIEISGHFLTLVGFESGKRFVVTVEKGKITITLVKEA